MRVGCCVLLLFLAIDPELGVTSGDGVKAHAATVALPPGPRPRAPRAAHATAGPSEGWRAARRAPSGRLHRRRPGRRGPRDLPDRQDRTHRRWAARLGGRARVLPALA